MKGFSDQRACTCSNSDSGKRKEDTGKQQAYEASDKRAFFYAALDHIIDFDLAFGILNDDRGIVDF
jgi:hypothetical protein